MAVYSLTVAGVEREVRVDGFDIRASLNGPDTLGGDFISSDASFRPAKRDPIIFTVDGTRKFAGFIRSVRERGIDGPGGDGGDGIVTTITAEDYSGQTRRRFITVTIDAGQTIKQALTAILAATSLDSVTLDVGQANGPTLTDPFVFVVTSVADALTAVVQVANELDAVGWYWRINYDGELQAFAPGSVVAPFDLIEGDGTECGDVEVEDSESEDFANRVIVDGGSLLTDGHTESFVSDGISATYQLAYTPLQWWVVTVNGNVYETIGTSPATWTIDPVAKTITRVAGVLPASTPLSITFNGRLDILGTASVGTAAASPPTDVWEKVIFVEGLSSTAEATARAQALVAALSASNKTARYPTYRSGLDPGQTQTITAAKRNLSGAWLITDVRTVYDGAVGTDGLRYEVIANEGGVVKGDFRQTYRQWIEGPSRTTVAVTEGGPTPVGLPAGVETDVQFNDGSGQFGADTGKFTYNKTTDTLGVNNIESQNGTDLSVKGALGTSSHGKSVNITGGAASASGAAGGNVTIAGGSTAGGTSMTAGSVTIKTGDAQFTSGLILITTGAIPATADGPSATIISIVPATQGASGSGTAFAGGGVRIKSGPGQADAGTALGNGTAGAGGPLLLEAGIGGAETVAGNTRVGGAGGGVTIKSGIGGAAPGGGGGTNTGGAGGDVLIQAGIGGTGSTANGANGKITLDAIRAFVSTSLPTSDPGSPGQLYQLSGVMMVSL